MKRKRLFTRFVLLSVLVILLLPVIPAFARQTATPAVILKANGPLTPAMVTYLERGLRIAEQENAAVIVLQLNTPGGSISLMNRMVQVIRNSTVPVIVYVAPSGSFAASAGTLITLSGHIAAMAPETTIGAASPVGSQGEDIGQTMEKKVKETLKASVRTLANRRGPEAVRLAETMIDDARAVTEQEALKAGLIDYVAVDINDVLRQANGRTVTLANEQKITLQTGNLPQSPVPYTFVETILQMLTDPNIVLLLLGVGAQALLIELSSPGGWIAGFIGVVCLALAGYGLGILPVNWFGIVFMVMAFVLFILDIKAPTHGALTVAGAGSFITGALVLFNSPSVPGFSRVSVPLAIGTGVFIALSFFAIMTFALRALKAPIRTGKESMVGRSGTARTAINPAGMVQAAAESWSAVLSKDSPPIEAGEEVEIVAIEGLHLIVRRKTTQE